MKHEATSQTSRRAVLGAAAGAVAAGVASALALPEAALAGSDGDVVLGAANVAYTTTSIEADGASPSALQVGNTGLGGIAISAEGEGAGLKAHVPGPPGTAIIATAGFGDGGQGGAIHAEGWSEFIGHVVMSRSGRATVVKGSAHVDIDLRSKGGLGGTPLCFANVMSYRPGLFVTMVRPNYPIAGKARIYLNKLANANTYVAWFVLG